MLVWVKFSLSAFLFLGVATRDWTLHPAQVGAIVLTCFITQIACCWLAWFIRGTPATAPPKTPRSLELQYVLWHPFHDVGCSARQRHQRELPRRFKQEAQTPARLTGWNIQEIRRKLPSVRVQAIGWWQHRWSALLPW